MAANSKQQLVPWNPNEKAARATPSYGDVELESPNCRTLILTLPYEEGKLRLLFKDVRAFMTSWDGDPNPFVTFKEAAARPSALMKVKESRWLASGHFHLDVESSDISANAWEHFYALASERSVHVAAREDVEAAWIPGKWSGAPGAWSFVEEA
ncbi:hypothetical protein [Brevundimonas sp. DWR2-3-1b1]|uniref:hypothetical protein n=1 Tax=Brevundimonas sp. DWR2-3-1b1 TaxID=2804641 RepID=UPI003CF4F061